MKIGFVVDKLPPDYIGGYETRIWSFATGLAAHHEVRIYTPHLGRENGIGGNPRKLPSGPPLAARSVASRSLPHSILYSAGLLKNPLDGWDPDVLIVEAIPYLHLYAMRRWVCSLPCRKVLDVVEAWAGYAPFDGVLTRPSLWIVRGLLSSGLDWADRAIVAATPTATSLENSYGYRSVDVVPVGIHFREPRERAAGRQDGATYDFVSVGRLVAVKRHLDFIAALGLLRSKGWKGSAVIVGTGPLAGRIRQAARAAGVEAQIRFAGQVSSEEKHRILARSKIFVLASEREGQSVATLEALSLGLPAIVARPAFNEVFGVSDMVADGENGQYYPVADVRTLAERMGQLLEDRERRLTFSDQSVAVARRYDWDSVLRRLEASLESVMMIP